MNAIAGTSNVPETVTMVEDPVVQAIGIMLSHTKRKDRERRVDLITRIADAVRPPAVPTMDGKTVMAYPGYYVWKNTGGKTVSGSQWIMVCKLNLVRKTCELQWNQRDGAEVRRRHVFKIDIRLSGTMETEVEIWDEPVNALLRAMHQPDADKQGLMTRMANLVRPKDAPEIPAGAFREEFIDGLRLGLYLWKSPDQLWSAAFIATPDKERALIEWYLTDGWSVLHEHIFQIN